MNEANVPQQKPLPAWVWGPRPRKDQGRKVKINVGFKKPKIVVCQCNGGWHWRIEDCLTGSALRTGVCRFKADAVARAKEEQAKWIAAQDAPPGG